MSLNGSKNSPNGPSQKERKVNGSGFKDNTKVKSNAINDLEFEGGAKVEGGEKSLDEMLKDD